MLTREVVSNWKGSAQVVWCAMWDEAGPSWLGHISCPPAYVRRVDEHGGCRKPSALMYFWLFGTLLVEALRCSGSDEDDNTLFLRVHRGRVARHVLNTRGIKNLVACT